MWPGSLIYIVRPNSSAEEYFVCAHFYKSYSYSFNLLTQSIALQAHIIVTVFGKLAFEDINVRN
jgi:hypothetical protein